MVRNLKFLFYVVGFLFFMILCVRFYMALTTDSVSYTELLLWVSIVYLCFVAAYLHPFFTDEDERIKFIKEKGLKITLFVVLTAFALISLINVSNVIQINFEDIFKILLALSIISIYTSWLILSKKY